MVPETLLHRVLHLAPPPPETAAGTTGAATEKAEEEAEDDDDEGVLDANASERTSRAARAQVRTMPDLSAPSAPRNTS